MAEIEVTRKIWFDFGGHEGMSYEVKLTGIPLDTKAADISDQLDELFLPEIDRALLATNLSDEENRTSVYTWKSIASQGQED